MHRLSLFASVVLCLPALAAAQATETIIPAGSLLECTLDEPNFSLASAQAGDPVICHVRGVEEFGRAVFPRGAYLAGHLAESKEPGHFWGKGSLKLEFDRISLPDSTLPVPRLSGGSRGEHHRPRSCKTRCHRVDDSSAVAVEGRVTACTRTASDAERGDTGHPSFDGRCRSVTRQCSFAARASAVCGIEGKAVEAASGVVCNASHGVSAPY